MKMKVLARTTGLVVLAVVFAICSMGAVVQVLAALVVRTSLSGSTIWKISFLSALMGLLYTAVITVRVWSTRGLQAILSTAALALITFCLFSSWWAEGVRNSMMYMAGWERVSRVVALASILNLAMLTIIWFGRRRLILPLMIACFGTGFCLLIASLH